MTQKEKTLTHISAVLLSILTLIVTIPSKESPVKPVKRYINYAAYVGSPLAINYLENAGYYPDTSEYRIALRLKKRLTKSRTTSPNVHVLAEAIKQRQSILKRRSTIAFQDEKKNVLKEWDVSPQVYPTWIEPYFSLTKARFTVSPDRISSFMAQHPLDDFETPVDVTLLGSSMNGTVLRASTSGIARPGYDINIEDVASKISEALNTQVNLTEITLPWRNGRIFYYAGKERKEFSLLSNGMSNFRGSEKARIDNVRKALKEHVNNVIVQPGETFSFVETLDPPVTLSKGWRMAKVIFNTDELRMSPGGGICQASTTVYRAIVNAGLPVVERRSHSLYVSYYKKYGVGIDATVFPGTQDLAFINDTGNPIIVQAYDTEDLDAVVNFYGIPDGRKVSLEGPYFTLNSPDDLLVNGRKVMSNEIVWRQNVIYPDGKEQRNLIVSRYKHLPQSIALEFIIKAKDSLAKR